MTPDQPSALARLSLLQDVCEVDVLVDFILGRPDKNLVDIGDKIVEDGQKLSHAVALQRFLEIKGNTDEAISVKDASFIFQMRDILNGLASPARGQTVLYTMFFSVKSRWFLGFIDKLAIARQAFPNMSEDADAFRAKKTFLSWLTLLITFLGALLLWQAYYGEQLAANFEVSRQKDNEIATRLYDALNATSKKQDQLDLEQVCALNQDQAKERSPNQSQVQLLCNEYAFRHAQLCAASHDVGAFGKTKIFEIEEWFLPAHEFGTSNCASHPSKKIEGAQEDAPTLAAMLAVISNYIIPILFGISGSLTAFLRKLHEKIKESLMTSRDSALTFVRIPLGVIAGIAVGLFYKGGNAAGSTLTGMFSLSSAGVAFMAGYAAEAFFAFLDKAIGNTFATKP